MTLTSGQSNVNPALHKLADILGNEDNGLGALARLYKQVDMINNDMHEEQTDDTLVDDTVTVGKQVILGATSVQPDYDPAFNQTKKDAPKEQEEEVEIVRPSDPIFRKPGFKRNDRS